MTKPLVVKIGGATVDHLPAAFWSDLALLQRAQPVVLVHGGGPQATALAHRLGHQPRMVQGRRVTTDLDLALLQWTARGEINTQLVAQAGRHGLRAVGCSGVDGQTLQVCKRPPWQIDGETVDFGWVGEVQHVDPGYVQLLLAQSFLPILAPLGVDATGQVYNVNADTVACALAAALDADTFLLVTEAGGLRSDPADPTTRLRTCSRSDFQAGVTEGWIQGGMRVKAQVAIAARAAGRQHVWICGPNDLRRREQGTQLVD